MSEIYDFESFFIEAKQQQQFDDVERLTQALDAAYVIAVSGGIDSDTAVALVTAMLQRVIDNCQT